MKASGCGPSFFNALEMITSESFDYWKEAFQTLLINIQRQLEKIRTLWLLVQ